MEQVQQQQTSAVVVTATPAAADLVSTMLQAHGVQAWTQAYASIYPSVDWVEGYRVVVAADAREEALRVLTALDRSDAVVLDGPEPA